MNDQFSKTVREKIADAAVMDFAAMPLVRREQTLPGVPGKAHAITGMRRAGKTCYLFQCLQDARARGATREQLVYFNFEDERLGSVEAARLSEIVESYYQRHPGFRRREEVVFCFDEIQLVPGWERFVRRLMDSEKARVFLSGSSSKMLSREVATSMRGRAMETTITPFSFREFLAAREIAFPENGLAPPARMRSLLQKALDDYLLTGGFPEARHAMSGQDRVDLLRGYVDTVLFRDVAERHGVGNLVALRAFVRQIVRNPAKVFSISKIAGDFASRGIAVSKETLLGFLDYFVDAFLVFALPVHTRSERRRQVNPRKLYLADHSLAAAFSPADGLERGRLLENMVACELLRKTRDLAYFKTAGGLEVDFLATTFDGKRHLIQVACDVSSARTWEREVRALLAARAEACDASSWLLCEIMPPPGFEMPEKTNVVPLSEWLCRK